MRLPLILLPAVAVLSCSDSLAPDTVAGNYTLHSLAVTTDTGGTVDWKSLGTTWTMSLAPNGTTTGQLFIPGAAEDGGDFTADMAGTWTAVGDTIEFHQTADTFVRDMPFVVRDDSLLTGDHDFGSVRIQVTLMK
jgi:hypothetical protein